MSEISRILLRLRTGDSLAERELVEAVYEELHRIAKAKLCGETPGALQATELVNEMWLRLIDKQGQMPPWENRRHFFGAAAIAMQRILIEISRRRSSLKRGGDRSQQVIDLGEIPSASEDNQITNLADALGKLEETEPGAAELVRLRYFTGLTHAEAAKTMDLPLADADRLWRYAKTWLKTYIVACES